MSFFDIVPTDVIGLLGKYIHPPNTITIDKINHNLVWKQDGNTIILSRPRITEVDGCLYGITTQGYGGWCEQNKKERKRVFNIIDKKLEYWVIFELYNRNYHSGAPCFTVELYPKENKISIKYTENNFLHKDENIRELPNKLIAFFEFSGGDYEPVKEWLKMVFAELYKDTF